MKITRKQLKQIIKEELSLLNEQQNSQDLHDRLMLLSREHGGEIELLNRLGEDGFNDVINIRNEFHNNAELEGYDAYAAFFKKVMNVSKEKSYGLFAKTISNLWDERHTAPDIEKIKALKSEYDDLKSQFEKVDATGTVDSMYGKRRSQTVRKDTGDVVRTSVRSSTPGLGS